MKKSKDINTIISDSEFTCTDHFVASQQILKPAASPMSTMADIFYWIMGLTWNKRRGRKTKTLNILFCSRLKVLSDVFLLLLSLLHTDFTHWNCFARRRRFYFRGGVQQRLSFPSSGLTGSFFLVSIKSVWSEPPIAQISQIYGSWGQTLSLGSADYLHTLLYIYILLNHWLPFKRQSP